jgi:hypothetical protein
MVAMTDIVRERMREFGSAGQTSLERYFRS